MERAKVAVAVAILRMKPEGVSGKDYTKQLCEKFQNKQLHWKEHYEKAENEILHLKQKLCMQDTNDLVNQEQIPNQELMVESSQFPTPPHSGNSEPLHRTKDADIQLIIQNTEFLHHVMAIQSGLKQLLNDRGLQEVTQESILRSLQALKNYIGKNTVSWAIQKQCVQCIVNLVNTSEGNLQTNLQSSIIDLCHSVTRNIMSSSDSKYESQEQCVQLLCMFGDCKPVQGMVIETLCESIRKYSEDLKQYVLKRKPLDTAMFCNSYYLLKACDSCLTNNTGDLQETVRLAAKDKLEMSLLCISDKFPLYAHTVWRICAKLY